MLPRAAWCRRVVEDEEAAHGSEPALLEVVRRREPRLPGADDDDVGAQTQRGIGVLAHMSLVAHCGSFARAS
jgi:hypothetical protein